ncbi:hypothetical protein KZI27_00985 (plasmid) [Curtobacterium sp. TC1]|uniref:hypothetical protein n=1 Tax=Curtobacterium sp. TC1 TaxID=2862880 RepID=UPI001C9B8519|nr:hypothetical protein [Curtobacterium sp. TC1]QZQ53750.1 hypothetical protein KZI27_00985 [Curtobacterium sp. TC1]
MRDRQPAEEQPTFTGDLLGGTIDCTPTGWISIDPFRDGNQEQWVATLITGVDHDPTLAIWCVTVRDRPAEPVVCFLAPVGASPRRLTAHAAQRCPRYRVHGSRCAGATRS